MAQQRPHFHLHHRLHLSLALNSPPPPFVFFFAIPFSPIDSHTARVLFRLSFSQPPSTRDVGCLVQRPKQLCMPNFPIDFRDLGGERRQRFTLFALSLSHSFLFLFFSLFLCVWFSRHSFIARRDSGFTTRDFMAQLSVICYYMRLRLSCLFKPVHTRECQMKYQTPPWLITRFFLFLLFFSFYFSSFFILFLSQIESLSRRVFGQWQHPKRRKDLRRDKKVQNKKNKKK